jgi:hypothetical protein
MRKFDSLFENAMWYVKEMRQKPSTDAYTNILRVIAALQQENYISSDTRAEAIAKQVERDRLLIIGADDKVFLPKIELKFKQFTDIDSLGVQATVLVKSNAISEPTKSFGDLQGPETIPDELISYIKKVQLELQTGDDAVETAPQDDGMTQPGNTGQTSLPTNSTPPAPEPQQQQPPPQ